MTTGIRSSCWALCLLTADQSGAAGGILSSALDLLTRHFKDSSEFLRWLGKQHRQMCMSSC